MALTKEQISILKTLHTPLFILAVGLLFLGIGTIKIALDNTEQTRLLEEQGKVVEANIISLDESGFGEKDVTVSYGVTDEKMFSKSFRIEDSLFYALAGKKKTLITCLPNNPKISAMGKKITTDDTPLYFAGGLIVLAEMGIIYAEYEIRKKTRKA